MQYANVISMTWLISHCILMSMRFLKSIINIFWNQNTRIPLIVFPCCLLSNRNHLWLREDCLLYQNNLLRDWSFHQLWRNLEDTVIFNQYGHDTSFLFKSETTRIFNHQGLFICARLPREAHKSGMNKFCVDMTVFYPTSRWYAEIRSSYEICSTDILKKLD
jgi:hypothetical protein